MTNLNALMHTGCRPAGFVLLITFLTASSCPAQTVLTIGGEVAKPLTLQATDLKAMPHVEVTIKERDGKAHRYAGIPLFGTAQTGGCYAG